MDHNKSKSMTTSVPSISVKFHANAEQIEEFYASDDDTSKTDEKSEKVSAATSVPFNIGESESSPLKYFNRLGKRSTSVDVSAQPLDASPPSDPWRFFTDIKGKITKSVEEKITEIKARNQEEGSPLYKGKSELPTVKDSKECSSVSDSEDLSESSISKTCGIVSTTEGVEMSSDEDTPSLEKDKKVEKPSTASNSSPLSLRQRFRFFKKNVSEEGTVKINDLSKLHNITAESADQALPEDTEGVENAVDALEESNLENEGANLKILSDDILKTVARKIENVELDSENVINVREVHGSELRERYFDCNEDGVKTVFAPSGFVDLRPTKCHPVSKNFHMLVLFISMAIYLVIQHYSPYSAGLAAGMIFSFIIFKVYSKLYLTNAVVSSRLSSSPIEPNKYFEVEAVKEYQPLLKYEGWVNEYPDVYSPKTYHISHTQSVFLRLQANLLRISHAKNKVPKRAMWSEPEMKANFTRHRIYNLVGAKITLLPEGLARVRLWSKKYPICITLSKDQMNFEQDMVLNLQSETLINLVKDKINSVSDQDKNLFFSPREKKAFRKYRKRDYSAMAQRFSKLAEDEEIDLDSDSRASTPSVEMSDIGDCPLLDDEDLPVAKCDKTQEDCSSLAEEYPICLPSQDASPTGMKIYIFGRTDREKEDWFRRLSKATHKGLGTMSSDSSISDVKETLSETLIEADQTEFEYLKYMSFFKPSRKQPTFSSDKTGDKNESQQEKVEEPKEDFILWLNALIGRVLFDCVRDPKFTGKVKDRIQRKLSTIKLPIFIEEILIPELSLGKTSPIIKSIGEPFLDERGLWIDLNINYEGVIVLTLQTKINLMRLKNPHAYEKIESEARSAIYHSDVDDSAESSSDEEGAQDIPNIPPDASRESGKRLKKMVDRLTESKIFQAATDNRYIKKAMEGVSNTDLRLTVEVKAIIGTLVLNIPPPPSDRIWIGFRPVPEISLSARPIVGERNISYIMVTNWIEKKLSQEFQKVLVIPNMEDFVIPVMNPKLPE